MEAITLDQARRVSFAEEFALRMLRALLHPLRALMAAPTLLFLAALTAMLLRHPDVSFYEIDRVAFVLLMVGVVGRAIVLQEPLLVVERAARHDGTLAGTGTLQPEVRRYGGPGRLLCLACIPRHGHENPDGHLPDRLPGTGRGLKGADGMADISLALVTYNQSGLLERFLENYFRNGADLMGLTIVDDGSDDATVGLLAALACRPGIRIHRLPHHSISRARNHARHQNSHGSAPILRETGRVAETLHLRQAGDQTNSVINLTAGPRLPGASPQTNSGGEILGVSAGSARFASGQVRCSGLAAGARQSWDPAPRSRPGSCR